MNFFAFFLENMHMMSYTVIKREIAKLTVSPMGAERKFAMRPSIKSKRTLGLKLLFTSVYLGVVTLLYIFRIPCLYHYFFGIQCPGCGMTRAYLSLLHGEWSLAFSYHPLFWTVPILFLLFLTDGKLFREKWANTILLGVILSGYMILFWIRLLSK